MLKYLRDEVSNIICINKRGKGRQQDITMKITINIQRKDRILEDNGKERGVGRKI